METVVPYLTFFLEGLRKSMKIQDNQCSDKILRTCQMQVNSNTITPSDSHFVWNYELLRTISGSNMIMYSTLSWSSIHLDTEKTT